MATYLDSYQEVIRLDTIARKRPKKLQCRPGYIQQGSACKKVTPGAKTTSAKVSAGGGGVMKSMLAAAAVAGISGAAVATAMKKDPEFVNKVGKKASEFSNVLSKELPKKLPKPAQKIIKKVADAINTKIGKNPSREQRIAKQIALTAASKVAGSVAAHSTAALLKDKNIPPTAKLLATLGVNIGTQTWAKNELSKRYGDPGLSKGTQFAIDLGVSLTMDGVSQAIKYSHRAEYIKKSKAAREEYEKQKQEKARQEATGNKAAGKAPSGKSWHDVLGVKPDASPAEIKKAYREMAQKYHPDINKDPDAEEKMKEINEAYKRLKKDGLDWDDIEYAYQTAKKSYPYVDPIFWVTFN